MSRFDPAEVLRARDIPASGRMPPYPYVMLGGMKILPQVDPRWNVIADKWVLPGCRVVTTQELYKLAAKTNLLFTLVRR